MARADVATERLWEDRLRRFELGDSSVAAFCRREGVSREAFDFWRARLGSGRGTTPPKRAARWRERISVAERSFLPVEIVGAATIEMYLPNGVRLAVPTTDRAALQAAIAAAGRLPAATSEEVEPC
jgi:hypothetical protein